MLAAVLRVFPVHRRRLDNPDGCIAFYRARWLLVLPVDGGPSFPIHLLGHHTTTAFEQVLGVRCHGSVWSREGREGGGADWSGREIYAALILRS